MIPPLLCRVEFMSQETCLDCLVELEEPPLYRMYNEWTTASGTRKRVYWRICRQCFIGWNAEIEAKANGARYTRVDCILTCDCGAPSIPAISRGAAQRCHTCWLEDRMLSAKQAALNFNMRLIRKLKKEIRDADEGRGIARDADRSDRCGPYGKDGAREGKGHRNARAASYL